MSKKKRDAGSATVYALPRASVIIQTLDGIIQKNKSPKLTLVLMPVVQQDATIYTTNISAAQALAFLCRYPYEPNSVSGGGEQQGLSLARISALRSRSRDELRYRIDPSAIVVSINEAQIDKKLIKKKNGRIRGMKYVALEIDLELYKKRLMDAELDEDGRFLYPESTMLGILVDGHHRIEAAYEEGLMGAEYPTSVYFEKSVIPEHLAEVFETVNKKRGAPSEIMVHAMRELSNRASHNEQDAAEVLRLMMTAEDSIFLDRIRMRGRGYKDTPAEAGQKYATNDRVFGWLTNSLTELYVANGGIEPITSLDAEGKYQLINDFFIAVSKVYPRAWGNKNYVLSKAMGIDIMMAMYPEVVRLHYTMHPASRKKLPTEKELESALNKAFLDGDRAKSLTLADRSHPLNWTSRGFGALSSGKGITQIKDGMRTMVREAMEDTAKVR